MISRKQLYILSISAGIIGVAALTFPAQTALTLHPQPAAPIVTSSSAGADIPGFTTTVIAEKETFPVHFRTLNNDNDCFDVNLGKNVVCEDRPGLTPLVNEDPPDGIDNDNDGRLDEDGPETGIREVEIIKKIVVTKSENKGDIVVTETEEAFAIVCDKTNLQSPTIDDVTIDCRLIRPLLPVP